MKIDDNYRIEKSTLYFSLIGKVEKIHESSRTSKSGKAMWKKGETYLSEEVGYFGNLKQALLGYLRNKIDDSEDIYDIVSKIEEAEIRIEEFIKNNCK